MSASAKVRYSKKALTAIYALCLIVFVALTSSTPQSSAAQRQKPHVNKPLTAAVGQAVSVPDNFQLDGNISEWESIPPTFRLIKKSKGSRNGLIWIGQAKNGIVVAGKIYGKPPVWPKAHSSAALGDHVEIWLADEKDVNLPPRNDCLGVPANRQPECATWYKRQIKYREEFKKLFIRQWQVWPDRATETFAADALKGMNAKVMDDRVTSFKNWGFKRGVGLLAVCRSPQVKFKAAPAKNYAYSFEVLIPWNAFPPMGPLSIKRLRMLVDVFSPGTGKIKYGPFSTTSRTRKYGAAGTFNKIKLAVPKKYFVTPCRYDLQGHSKLQLEIRPWFFNNTTAYYFPGDNPYIYNGLVVGNPQQEFFINSPDVYSATYFAKQIGNGKMICGPQLSFLSKGRITKSKYAINSLKDIEIKHLPDGNVLIKEGPLVYSYYSSGACGAAPIIKLDIYHISKRDGSITKTFDFNEKECMNLHDANISSDWKKITTYWGRSEYVRPKHKGEPGELFLWNSTTYCYKPSEMKYELCGEKEDVPGPSPRHELKGPSNIIE